MFLVLEACEQGSSQSCVSLQVDNSSLNGMSNGELNTSDGSDSCGAESNKSDEFDDSDDASLNGNSSSVGPEGTALHACEPSCSQPSFTQTTCALRPSTQRHKPACATSALTSLALARQH